MHEECIREIDLAAGTIVVAAGFAATDNHKRPCRSTSSRWFRTPSAGSPSSVRSRTVLGTEIDLRLFGYRDTTPLPNGQVDDAPYGGGPGMVLRVDVVAAALDAVYGGVPEHRVIALTPQGRQLDQEVVEELAGEERLTLLSARFEGFDERILTHLCSDAISIGPYVLSGGELPAMVLVDAIARLQPGALAEGSAERETFSAELEGGVEFPHYTRPAEFRGWRVPDVLVSGDHGRIEDWRLRAEPRPERPVIAICTTVLGVAPRGVRGRDPRRLLPAAAVRRRRDARGEPADAGAARGLRGALRPRPAAQLRRLP